MEAAGRLKLRTRQDTFDIRFKQFLQPFQFDLVLLTDSLTWRYILRYKDRPIIEINTLPYDDNHLEIWITLLDPAYDEISAALLMWASIEHDFEFLEDDWPEFVSLSISIHRILKPFSKDPTNFNIMMPALISKGVPDDAWQGLSEPEMETTGKPGRPRNKDNEWAYQQVRELGRSPADVYPEWLERTKKAGRQLADPTDSFRKATKPKREKTEITD